MNAAGLPLFSVAGLTVLDRQVHDPAARASYELMSGGLIWPDEFPPCGGPEWMEISPNWVYRDLIAYRASITLGKERDEFQPVWEQVTRHASNWPGLRAERRGEKARRRLLAAKRREARCLAEFDMETGLDDPVSTESQGVAPGSHVDAPSGRRGRPVPLLDSQELANLKDPSTAESGRYDGADSATRGR